MVWMVLVYCTIMTLLAVPSLLLLLFFLGEEVGGNIKSRIFWAALNVLMWDGILYPIGNATKLMRGESCFSPIHVLLQKGSVNIPQAFAWMTDGVVYCLPGDAFLQKLFLIQQPTYWICVLIGFGLVWMLLGTYRGIRFGLSFLGCLVLIFSLLLFLILLVLLEGIFAIIGAIVCPLIMLYHVWLLLLWRSSKTLREKPIPPEPEDPERKPIPPDPEDPERKRKPIPPKPKPEPIPPKPKPKPIPPRSKPETESVAVKALRLSGVQGHKDFAPDADAARSMVLEGRTVSRLSGVPGYPVLVGVLHASPKGGVWILHSNLGTAGQLLHNGSPAAERIILSAGDTLTLKTENGATATLYVAFRILICTKT